MLKLIIKKLIFIIITTTIIKISLIRMYYKIINKQWNHNGHQYVPGLNILQEEFNDNPNDRCCKGGFYFTRQG